MIRVARALVVVLTVGCGATRAPGSGDALTEAVAEEPEARAMPESTPPAAEPATRSWPAEIAAILTSDVATIEIELPDAGRVHHCRFTVLERRPVYWACFAREPRETVPLDARTSERLGALLANVTEWGRPLADDDVRPSTLTLQGARGPRLRFDADPAIEPDPLRALQTALMSAAQDALAQLRSMPEGCSGCRDGEYCEEDYMCETLGPDKGAKNCAVVPQCHGRLPRTSHCQHDYQCQSRHCVGTGELVGTCG